MRRIKLTALLTVLAATSATAAAAQAAPVTVGPPLNQPFGAENFGLSLTVSNTVVPGGFAASPVNGAVIAWRTAEAAGGPLRLRVLRPVPGGVTGVGTSAPVVPAGAGIQTFQTSLPIRAGDLIGIDNTNPTDKIGLAAAPGSAFTVWTPQRPDGTLMPSEAGSSATQPDAVVGLNAVVQPAPTLTAISPASGSIKGGTPVTVAGTDFANVSGVSFGGVPAASFAVASEGQIVAVSPPGQPGTVDVAVTTVAGTTGAAKFAYKACVVPPLKNKKLKGAKKRLRKAGCKPGNVRLKNDATRKTGRVVKQGPKAGKVFAPGKKVNITLG